MNWNTEPNTKLIDALLSLKTNAEARSFLRDLLTEKEINELSKRFLTARMLSADVSYTDIQKLTGFSSATVARVAKWLKAGKGGYRLAIARTQHHTSISQRGA